MRTVALLLLVACGPNNAKPKGTTADPVEVCESVEQVCKIDNAKLGVCTQGRGSALVCASQH